MFPIISVISRSFIIALRYGVMSDARWEILHQRNQAIWVKSDFIRAGWENLQLPTCLREIQASKYRLQIEDEDFNFTFLERLSPEQHEKLSNFHYYGSKNIRTKDIFAEIKNSLKVLKKQINNEVNNSRSKSKFDSNVDSEENKELEPPISRNVIAPDMPTRNNMIEGLKEDYRNFFMQNKTTDTSMIFGIRNMSYSGESILREMWMLEAQRQNNKWIIRIIGIVRIMLILGIQFRTPSLVTVFNVGDWILYLLLIIVSLKLHTLTITFILTGVSDFKRKLFYMRMMSSLIDPDK